MMKNIKQSPASGRKKSPGSKKTSGNPTNWSYYYLAGILLLVFFLFSNALHNEIVTFDDNEYFQNYPEVLRLNWASILKFFSRYYVIMYQPLPVLSFALNYHFSGLNTFPLHLVNLCFHLANVILVYQFIRLLTGKSNTALIVALLFGIHPMNVEAVCWISARSSSMYTFFYLFSLIYYINYLKNSLRFKYIGCAVLFFIFSLFSKAQAVTLPVVLLLLDFYFDRKILSRKVIIEKIPFFLLSIIFGIITLMDKSTQSNLATGMIVSYSPIDIFFIVCHSFVFYFEKLILPFSLCSVYVYPPKEGNLLPVYYYVSAVIVIAALWTIYKLRKNKQIIFAIGLFLLTIAINIQLIPSRLFEVTDRYAYFPYIGLYLIPLFYLEQLKERNQYLFEQYKPYLITLLLGFIIFFSVTVHTRNQVWANDETLMTDIISKNPPVGYIYRAYGNRGFYFKKTNRPKEAIADFTEAAGLNPDDARNYFNRGLAYILINDQQAALADFNKAILLDPKQPMIYSNRAQLKFNLKDWDGAETDCRKGLQLDSSYSDLYNTLANIEFNRKNYSETENNLNLAIQYKPDFDIAIKNRGLLYLQIGKNEEACKDLHHAAELGNQEAFQAAQQYCR